MHLALPAWGHTRSRPLRRVRGMDDRWSRHAVHGWGCGPLRQSRPVQLSDPVRAGVARGSVDRADDARSEEAGMTKAELLAVRSGLADRRGALLDRLATDTTDMIEPGFLRLLADLHTTIVAVDAALAEAVAGDAP